jgi:LPXTG-site transpeptidase (sortase) family protein
LFIPAIGVNTTVAAKPSSSQWDEFLGKNVESFGVPSDMYTTTWWNANAQGKQQPRPGGDGMAIILGHTQIGAYGVFNKLGQLRPGQVAAVSGATDTLKYTVLSVTRDIPKNDGAALSRVLTQHPSSARLALITCSGHFNGRESVQNTVVFLQPLAA